MVSQILLQGLGDGHSPEWYYNEAGKPLFRDYPGHFSISHSRDFVGLVYHPLDKCGIDLEELREKILVIASRFTHDAEAAWVRKTHELEDITLIWSVKEALFKTIGGGGIHFKTQLRVWSPFRQSNRHGHGIAVFDGAEEKMNFSYYYIYLEGVLLVHTIAMESPA
jgi:phosphopantetheinyl transferase